MASRRWVRAIWAAALLVLGAPTATLACSPAPGYVRPSNFELVQIADTIVVAQAIGAKDEGKEDFFGRKVVFRVVQTLKGEAVGDIEVAGLALGRTRPSDPRDILSPHPEAYMGACNRVTMAKGGTYVLFLEKRGKGYAPLGHPFSRVDEDYAGEASPWMRLIRTYLRLQTSEAPMAQVATLEAIRAEILAKTPPTRDEQAEAIDIAFHLGAPSPWKPTAFLLAAYDDVKAGRPPRYKPRPSAFDAEQSEAAAFTGLILAASGASEDGTKAPPRRDPRLTALLEMMIEGDHPDARALFDTLAAPGAPVEDLALAIRFYAKNGRYREAYGLIEDRAAPLVATAPEADAQLLLQTFREVQQDNTYDETHRWRDDPASAARWPRLALALSKTAQARFGEAPGFDDSLKSLLGADYRAQPDLALMLSGDYAEITDWARRELARPEILAVSDGGPPGDPLVLPLTITLRWMGVTDTAADQLAPVFCRDAAHRRLIFDLWGRHGSWTSGPEMSRLGASPVLDDGDRKALAAAFTDWDRHHMAEVHSSALDDSPALRKLAQGLRLGAKDIKPLKPVTCPVVVAK